MGVWFKHYRLLCSRIPLANRLQRLCSTAGAAFLFGAEGWALSTETCRRCNVLEGRWLRATWHKWGPAATRVARSKGRAVGFPSLWSSCCQQVHRLMGHLALHLARPPPQKPAAAVYRWRPPLWRQAYQTLRGLSGWRHGTTNWIREPEDCLAKV